jgi:hypothetical protein
MSGARTRVHYRAVTVLVVGSALVLAGRSPVAAQDIGYTASFFVARATSSTETFESIYVFNSVDVSHGPLRLTFSVPFVRQHFVADATIDPFDGSEIPAVDETSTGFGDPLVRVDVALVDDFARALQIGVAASIKPAVVDVEDGLGTGEADFGVGMSAFKAVGRTSLLFDAMYWKYGDPEGVDFENSLSYSMGVARIVGSGRWSPMVSVSGFSSGFAGLPAPVQLNFGVLGLVQRRQSLAVTASFGVTESAGDFSLGVSWRIGR